MLGARKRFIESISSNSKQQRLGGTAATLLGMTQGIKIHRVHDVKNKSSFNCFERLFNRWKKFFYRRNKRHL